MNRFSFLELGGIMNKRIIFHVDVNSAYLSWEAVHRLKVLNEEIDLRTLPSAVGGDMSKRHGIILAKSTPAKKYGIITGEPIQAALKKCPNLVLVPPNHALYSKYSKDMFEILYSFTPDIEPFSVDEAFLDMTGAILPNKTPIETAEILKNRIYNELGFTVNVGISTNKLLAKMASDFKKPDMIHTLFPEEMPIKMWPLPLIELFFVGKSSAKILKSLGFETIGDIANCNVKILKAHLGNKHGELIHNYANGIDNEIVQSLAAANKGYGNSTTLAQDILDFDSAKHVLLLLSETVGGRLRGDNVTCSCITVEYTDCNFVKSSHQTTLVSTTNSTTVIYETACKLLKNSWSGVPLRLLGIRTSKIKTEEYNQMNLFDMAKTEKLQKLDKALDNIRGKYGNDAITRASIINSHLDKH